MRISDWSSDVCSSDLFEDVRKLLEVLQALVEQGNTVIVIEHNLEVIKTADHIVDLGPEGGDGGGRIVASGTPEEVAGVPGSYNGASLARYRNPPAPKPAAAFPARPRTGTPCQAPH